MDEVTGPVIAVALVLSAVFVPCAFISGITGQFFRQFALTIAASTVISAFNSLTLSPALAVVDLQRPKQRRARPRSARRCRGGSSALGCGWAATSWRLVRRRWLADVARRRWAGRTAPLDAVIAAVLLPGIVVGGAVGWLHHPAGQLRSLGLVLPRLQPRRSTASPSVYGRAVGWLLRAER